MRRRTSGVAVAVAVGVVDTIMVAIMAAREEAVGAEATMAGGGIRKS